MSDTKGVATFVKQRNGHGEGRVYRVEPPMPTCEDGDTEHVWVSAVVLPMDLGTETYIFASDEDGEITSWLELDGSMKNTLDHAEALRAAGYEVSA